MASITLVDGSTCEIVHQFNENRCIVLYDGLFVFVDRDLNTNSWDFSDTPASGDEMVVLKTLVDSSKDSVVRS